MDNSEPAFPSKIYKIVDSNVPGSKVALGPFEHPGISKLEYFAGQALMGIMCNWFPSDHNAKDSDYRLELEGTAKICIDMAEAMIEELEERKIGFKGEIPKP